ncbi:OB-fold putative lipoprotein [Psychrobacter pacificensis]|uniref:OB-fold putative lipoprotein n=1 Tax=Psychrobacter pacificensis TaxID=112002 RepID=UPI001CBCA766|nr:OB-fold putative lipoprotein [Psychrobacter pacificensis]MBZ1392289.1 hypothetical protein [Psychrobacter pacificensis]
MKKIVKWIVIIVIALFIIGLIFGSDDAETTTTSTSSETVAEAPTETATPVTAQEIFEAYDNNEVAADQQYKDKPLLVTGKVSGISSDFMDDAQVQLATSNEFMDVMASGDDTFNSAAATLSKGQKITMLCQGGGEVVGSPMLSDCVIQ